MMTSLQSYFAAWNRVDLERDITVWATQLKDAMLAAKAKGGRIYLCANGGSAANAMHIANDFVYGYLDPKRRFDIEALTANTAVLTCLGNDIGFDKIFAHQLENKLTPHDLVVVLSGSGNSPNILRALETTKSKGATSVAILGYSNSKVKPLADIVIDTCIEDMQVAEDLQVMIAHAVMRMLTD